MSRCNGIPRRGSHSVSIGRRHVKNAGGNQMSLNRNSAHVFVEEWRQDFPLSLTIWLHSETVDLERRGAF